MIRYPISEVELRSAITAENATWLGRAAERTEGFRQAGVYAEASSIWSDIKPVYMRLQFDKCAYCERKGPTEVLGRIEHDLEHYRPKKNAKPWNLPESLSDEDISITAPVTGSLDPGYHLLAYHIFNYCTACKTCNSPLKSNYFPISGIRNQNEDNPQLLSSESALLLYPVGEFDTDPEEVIEFFGLFPRPMDESGFDRKRALVTIAFFELGNPEKRKNLFIERANVISSLHAFLRLRENEGDTYSQLVELLTGPNMSHSNCARSFVTLFEADREEADSIFNLIVEFLASVSE